ncbi:MAG: hypothetical protein CM1200mP15_23120 [Dehalococcoidia bacterium]|nr:MAG: hypothetical protein CM1200mP15_23120 [Dehalococcoidia bacterium]
MLMDNKLAQIQGETKIYKSRSNPEAVASWYSYVLVREKDY